MKRVDVVCLGILVADAIARPVDAVPEQGTLALVEELTLRGGGGALNTSTWLARSGVRVAAAGKVGADVFGDFLLELLSARGVQREGVIVDQRVPTSATVVLVDSHGERTFLHLPGANGALRAAELDRDVIFGGHWLLLTGALVLPGLDGAPAADLLAEARAREIATAVDTVFDPTGRWDRIVPVLAHVDLFTPSLAEARAITGEHDPALIASALHELGVREVALKLGPNGAYVSGDGFCGCVAPVAVHAIDSTGAGDAFIAGLLYGKLAGWPLERCVRLANAAGAYATTAVGAADAACDLDRLLDLTAAGAPA